MTTRSKLLKALPYLSIAALMLGCFAPADEADNPATVRFRAALVSAEDVAMQAVVAQSGGRTSQALNGEPSGIASLTADAVRGTNAFLTEHFDMMDKIVAQPPTLAEEDRHTWEGTHKTTFIRVVVERSDAPRGERFDYTLEAGPVGQPLLPLISGHVVRVQTRQQDMDKQGFGVVRFHFTNIAAVMPEHPVTGISRIAFRRVGDVHQVSVRMINMNIPDDPEYPKHSAYGYVLMPNSSGALRWFSKADVMKDGAPLENITVHSAWRGDRSGLGAALFTGGSLNIDGNPIDWLNITECWDTQGISGFVRQAIPDFSRDFGAPASCFQAPDSIDVPEFDETLPDEDPAIPSPHAAEVGQ